MTVRFLLALLVGLALLAGCGGDDEPAEPARATVDQAFVTRMAAHTEVSRRLAEQGVEDGGRAVRRIARDMVRAREEERNMLRGLQQRLGGAPAGEDPLGVSPEQAAETVRVEALEGADPFDEFWLQMMSQHHRGALELIKAEQAKGKDPATRSLADRLGVTRAQELGALGEAQR